MAAAKKKKPKQENEQLYVPPPPPREEVLFSWKALARPFKERNKEFWVSIVVMASIASLILLLIEGVISVLLVVSVVFLYYVLTSVKPDEIDYKITTYGIRMGEDRVDMDLFTRFWFSKRLDTNLLIVERVTLPGRMEFVINKKDEAKIRDSLSRFIPEEEAPPTNLDKATNWFSEKIPGSQ